MVCRIYPTAHDIQSVEVPHLKQLETVEKQSGEQVLLSALKVLSVIQVEHVVVVSQV